MAKRKYNRREAAKAIAWKMQLPAIALTELMATILENTREVDGLFKLLADLEEVEEMIAPAVMVVIEHSKPTESILTNCYTSAEVKKAMVNLPWLAMPTTDLAELKAVLKAVNELPDSLANQRTRIQRELRKILRARHADSANTNETEIKPFNPDVAESTGP